MSEGREIDEMVRWFAGRRGTPSGADGGRSRGPDAWPVLIDEHRRGWGGADRREPTDVDRWERDLARHGEL